MKTIRQIFIDDILSLAKNFFALVIAIGICFLPALYAWFNIYSNWDPYGNTGALKMAIYSADKGYTDEKGVYKNQGDTIVDNLHDNKSVDWQFVDSEEDAINGVYSGDFYAAVVVDENFTYSMYNVFSEGVDEPTLHFYENQKKNPVATKISDTVVSTLQNNINEAFIDVVISEVFSKAAEIYDEVKVEGGADGIIANLKDLNEKLGEYQKTINAVITADEKLIENLGYAEEDTEALEKQSEASAAAIDKSNESVAVTQTTFNSYMGHVNEALDNIQGSIDDINKAIDECAVSEDYQKLSETLARVLVDLQIIDQNEAALKASIAGVQVPSVDTSALVELVANTLASTSASEVAASEEAMKETLSTVKRRVSDLQTDLNINLIPQVNDSIDKLEVVLDNTSDMLLSMADTFDATTTMFQSLGTTLVSADTSLQKTNEALNYINNKLSNAIESAEAANTEERMEVLVDTLAKDPSTYGAFFSEPVQIKTQEVYPIANYGSAVAPFYTTLAIWVGALILTAIIKVHPDKKKYPEATHTQLFFGRYVLYWVLAQLQALVIVFGDVVIFKIQCLHPGYFTLAACVTATTFSMLIYSLVITWGDVGKALSVVIVVLQIAGSSGTYPIELLPEFFRKVYIFFPFPYAINAMRECICGMYETDFAIYLLELSLFIIVALVIGLLLKIPFEEINHYMEERMEETEMM